LPVITASDQELAIHEQVLLQMDKASNGKTLFRKIAEISVA
jgi:DNA polymerase III subunit epsilon